MNKSIHIRDFAGIVPSVDEYNLPTNGAQRAHNLDLSGGTLRPLKLTNDNTRLHNADGELIGDVTEEEFGEGVPKAGKIDFGDERIKMCVPWWKTLRETTNGFSTYNIYGWLYIQAYMTYEYVDETDGQVKTEYSLGALIPYDMNYNDVGFVLSCQFTGLRKLLQDNRTYTVKGPFYQVIIYDYENTRNYMGHPNTGGRFPNEMSPSNSKVPDIALPLYYPSSMDDFVLPDPSNEESETSSYQVLRTFTQGVYNRTDLEGQSSSDGHQSPSGDASLFQYGTLTIDDVDGPHIDEVFTAVGNVFHEPLREDSFKGVNFSFNCNYVDRRPKKVFYIQQNVDAEEREGEESEVSEEIIVKPGEVIKLLTPRPSANANGRKLFRSARSGAGFEEFDFVEAGAAGQVDYFLENFRQAGVDRLKPNGTLPYTDLSQALLSSVRHPAGFVLYKVGKDLRPSAEYEDLERAWAVPQEYAHTFDSEIKGMILAGSTVLVYTENRVYRVFGQHPARLSVSMLSNRPVLDVKTIWRDGDTVGWLNEEGIVAYTGGENLITGNHFRAEQWNALNPSDYSAVTNDRNVLLYNTCEDNNIRFDFRGDRLSAISTFDVDDGSKEWKWKSKLFRMDSPLAWHSCQLIADEYPFELSIYADRKLVSRVGILNDTAFLLPRLAKSKTWEFELKGQHEVRDFVIATSIQQIRRQNG